MAISSRGPLAVSRSGPGALTLFAGPLAWFAQLNIGYVLATAPCFPEDQRLLHPAPAWAWSHAGLFWVAALCLLLAFWSFLVSWAALRRHSDGAPTWAVAADRSRFTALWGVAFGGGFFLATLLTGAGLLVLPRCGG